MLEACLCFVQPALPRPALGPVAQARQGLAAVAQQLPELLRLLEQRFGVRPVARMVAGHHGQLVQRARLRLVVTTGAGQRLCLLQPAQQAVGLGARCVLAAAGGQVHPGAAHQGPGAPRRLRARGLQGGFGMGQCLRAEAGLEACVGQHLVHVAGLAGVVGCHLLQGLLQCRLLFDRQAGGVPVAAQGQRQLQRHRWRSLGGGQHRVHVAQLAGHLGRRRHRAQPARPSQCPGVHGLFERGPVVGRPMRTHVLAHRLQQAEAGLRQGLGVGTVGRLHGCSTVGISGGPQQRVAGQVVQPGRHGRGRLAQHHGQRAGGGVAREAAQRRQQALGRRVQQAPAPGDDLRHRGVPRVMPGTRPAARQQRQVRAAFAAQQADHLGRREVAHTRCGQLDGQRHAVQRAHQRCHGGVVARAEVEVAAHRTRPVDEQRHRRVGGGDGQVGVDFGQRQRVGPHQRLAVQPERPARGDQQVKLGQRRQQPRQVRLGVTLQLLEVVQHQQHRLAGQRLHQAGAVVAGVGRQLQGARHGRQHLGRLLARHQRHEGGARKEGGGRIAWPGCAVAQGLHHLHRQPCLAAAARAQQRDQPGAAHQRLRVGHGLLGPEQPRQVGRQRRQQAAPVGGGTGRRRGCWGRRGGRRRRHLVRQRLGQAFVQCRQALALVVHPVVEVAGHQLAAVQLRGGAGLAGTHELLETPRVAAQPTGHHAHRQAVGLQHGRAGLASGFKQALQGGQRLAQAVAAHGQLDTGPQQLDQLFAGMGALRRQRQAGQQRGHGPRRKAQQLLSAVAGFERPQQAHLPARLAHGRVWHR